MKTTSTKHKRGRPKKGLTIGKTRTALYTTAKVLGYVNAVNRGTLLERLLRHLAGKQTAKLLSKLFKG